LLLVAPVRPDKQRLATDEAQYALFRIDKLKVKRSVVPAITHVDYSARIQTVDPVRHPKLHRLMTAFRARTGCPVIINTSSISAVSRMSAPPNTPIGVYGDQYGCAGGGKLPVVQRPAAARRAAGCESLYRAI
jgi:hypothetical protein